MVKQKGESKVLNNFENEIFGGKFWDCVVYISWLKFKYLCV